MVSKFKIHHLQKILSPKSFLYNFYNLIKHTNVSVKKKFQKLFTKQMAWLDRACSTDSIDIKFAKFVRAEQKLWNLQIGTSN